ASVRFVSFPPYLISLFLILILLGVRAGSPSPVSSAATLPVGFAETQIAAGLASPTAMAIAPDGRIFVCLQAGAMRVIKNGALLPTPFLTLSVSSLGERGLLGVAFDPDFANNQFVYVYYTPSAAPLHNRVSRFTAGGDAAVPGSETVILELDNLSANSSFHNGGAMHFGPDGKLYIAVGDDVVSTNSQTLTNLLGKILRINPDGSIPAENPFYGTASGKNRAIWAFGFRNPYTFAIQPGTGRIFANDVGQTAWEEIDDVIAGANYGWPTCEGACNPPKPGFQDPVHAFQHLSGACAITGAAFYNPTVGRFPAAYFGKYFFGDYCAGWIKFLDPATGAVSDFATGLSSLVDLEVSVDGDLYYLQRGAGGQVWRIEYTASQSPVITQHPGSLTVTEGGPASFSVSVSGTAPFSYQWQRDGVDIAGATAGTHSIAAAALGDSGARFRCTVSNEFGAATSNEATLTVTTNQAPIAAITTPVAEALYQGGQTITYAGTGTDPETGALPTSAFTWQVDFHHDTHTHPQVPATSGASGGSFVIPIIGETSTNVWYRIHLTVTDSLGASHSTYRDIHPNISTITLQTSPPEMVVTVDGQPTATPTSFQSVIGVERVLGAVLPQSVGGTEHGFGSWSDGGAVSHAISTPSANSTYTATFVPCSYAISPTSQTVSSAGGTGTVGVTAPAGCAWTATSNAPWITVIAGGSGSGNGTVNYTVSEDASPLRTGTITIAGHTFTITQSPACEYSVSPAGQTVGSAGGAGTVNVAAGAGCAWTAASNAPWVSINEGSSGSGGGSVGYQVDANAGPQRTGTITAAGQTFTITQSVGCAYSISPTSQTAATGGGSGAVNVTAGAGCAWTAASNAAWITVTAGGSGSGNGTITYSIAANAGAQRTGTITAAGQIFTVTQGTSCSYSISPTSRTISSPAKTGTVSVTAGAGCARTAVSNASWITVTTGATGTGNGSVGYSVPVNTGPQRVGAITIAGLTFTLTQTSGCSFSISPTSQNFPVSGGTGVVAVAAGDPACPWTAKSNNTGWITITAGASGTGNGTVGYSVKPRTSGSTRTGSMTIAGIKITITQ
ncbi:MAG: PQQ-dependent sugar dehydrogenase, partial [Blastocatellia bacterium]